MYLEENVVVIGGGPAGIIATARASQGGLNVTLIEKENLGGCCLNHGCIPSKALLTASDLAYTPTHSEKMGIKAEIDIEYEKTIGWKDDIIKRFRNLSEKTLEKQGVDIKKGKASFASSNEIIVENEDEENLIEFDKAIIATGSKPIEIPGLPFDNEYVLNARQFLSLTDLPERLVIVGAGYIGMEIGTVCAKLGTHVEIIEMMNQILPGWDKRIIKPLRKKSEKIGINFHFGVKADKINNEDGEVSLTAETNSGDTKEFRGDKCLVTVGRQPKTDGLELEKTDVEVDKKGFIETDSSRKTEDSNIYAAGDVAGEPMLAHKAFRDGAIAADSLLGKETPPPGNVPSVVFTDPQIAQVGRSPSKSSEPNQSVGRAYFRALEAAHTKDKSEGLARILIDEDTGVILGADIVGPDASELIHELALAVEKELKVKDLVDTIHTHPTLSEIIAKVAERAGGLPPHSF